jgi:hypothetical protein
MFFSTKYMLLTYANTMVTSPGQGHQKELHYKFIRGFIIRQKHGKNVFKVLLSDYLNIPRTFNISSMKLSIVDHTIELAIPLLLLRLKTIREITTAA